jgi:ATP-dependent Clp protease ATP-binding subunit ClpA
MFERLRQRVRDMGTIKVLCEAAERHALAAGQREAGAEHFLLAALELPDGSARRAFERAGADAARLGAAIEAQYRDALTGIGVDPEPLEAAVGAAEPLAPAAGFYRAAPSGQAVMQRLAGLRAQGSDAPLLGCHVVAVVAGMPQGVAPRALRAMGVEPQALARAAGDEAALSRRAA